MKSQFLGALFGGLLVLNVSLLSLAQDKAEYCFYRNLEEMKRTTTRELFHGVRTKMLMESDANWLKQSQYELSDIELSLIQFSADMKIDFITGHAVIINEAESHSGLTLDEGTAIIGATDGKPWFIEAGKRYLPFGMFYTHFAEKPLTMTVSKTRETTLMGGYNSQKVRAVGGVFNGSLDENPTDPEDKIDDFFFSFRWVPSDIFCFDAAWISDFGESDFIQQSLFFETIGYRRANGIASSAAFFLGHFSLYCEITASETLKILGDVIPVNTPVTNDTRYVRTFKPMAWNIELGTKISDRFTVALKADGSDEISNLPEYRLGIGFSYVLNDYAALKTEYMAAEFSDLPDAHSARMQLNITY